jgi:hypothetical protein
VWAVALALAETSAPAAAHLEHRRSPPLNPHNVPRRGAIAAVHKLALSRSRAGLIAVPDLVPDRPELELALAAMSLHVPMQAVVREQVAVSLIA